MYVVPGHTLTHTLKEEWKYCRFVGVLRQPVHIFGSSRHYWQIASHAKQAEEYLFKYVRVGQLETH